MQLGSCVLVDVKCSLGSSLLVYVPCSLGIIIFVDVTCSLGSSVLVDVTCSLRSSVFVDLKCSLGSSVLVDVPCSLGISLLVDVPCSLRTIILVNVKCSLGSTLLVYVPCSLGSSVLVDVPCSLWSSVLVDVPYSLGSSLLVDVPCSLGAVSLLFLLSPAASLFWFYKFTPGSQPPLITTPCLINHSIVHLVPILQRSSFIRLATAPTLSTEEDTSRTHSSVNICETKLLPPRISLYALFSAVHNPTSMTDEVTRSHQFWGSSMNVIFSGNTETKITCKRCGYQSTNKGTVGELILSTTKSCTLQRLIDSCFEADLNELSELRNSTEFSTGSSRSSPNVSSSALSVSEVAPPLNPHTLPDGLCVMRPGA
ncbi:hypothetical protein PR048_016562 [Dryococelus australis]|uniref:Uncharacterized protein n=1 Tax=Dryococelus australis TaxID=614101 RepID=A0ABQ9HK42_9NEOP|nr:hypothetical protein PR048_016562 [Dryococelus australis]